ncbi:MAG: OmpA family protein [Rhizobiaceae bacterium]
MLEFQKFTAILSLTFGALCVAPALSQSTDASSDTAEELVEKFNNQLGTTRGLILAPSGDDTTADADTTKVTNAPANDDFIQIAEEDQVNIQITFDFDSSALRDDQKPKLATLCQVINSVDIDLFRIVGHTDASGSADYNKNLSLLRAQEVKRHMVNDCGIPETRLEAIGVGESFLLDSEDPRGDVNRRVEFQALS